MSSSGLGVSLTASWASSTPTVPSAATECAGNFWVCCDATATGSSPAGRSSLASPKRKPYCPSPLSCEVTSGSVCSGSTLAAFSPLLLLPLLPYRPAGRSARSFLLIDAIPQKRQVMGLGIEDQSSRARNSKIERFENDPDTLEPKRLRRPCSVTGLDDCMTPCPWV